MVASGTDALYPRLYVITPTQGNLRGKKPEPALPVRIGIEVEDDGSVLRITDVAAGGPADGTLKTGDVIVTFAGTKTTGLEGLKAVLRTLEPDKEVTVSVFREGKEVTVRIVPRKG